MSDLKGTGTRYKVPAVEQASRVLFSLAGSDSSHQSLNEICARNGMAVKKVTPEVLTSLSRGNWPGNVRELKNTVERLIIFSSGNSIDMHVLESVRPAENTVNSESLELSGTFQEFKERAEAAFIKRQLDLHQWNITKTAKILDIQQNHLYTKMKRYGLTNEDVENNE